ncbi:MAG: hypothetical protein GZ086_05665 [Gelidibacter sp.]|nr:hypothetical protein [Gelidibacter sp.]
MKLQKLFFAAVIVLSANATFAQVDSKVATHLVTISIPEVALLDLEVASGTTTVALAGTAPTEAGLPMTFGAAATNATIWMNYSSIVKGALLRNVGVAITQGLATLPVGLKLTVEAGVAAATGAGTKGTASSVLTLSGTSQNIVTGIGSAYTGTGATGHNLTYKLDYATSEAANYAALKFDDTAAASLTITYTLSDSI